MLFLYFWSCIVNPKAQCSVVIVHFPDIREQSHQGLAENVQSQSDISRG